MTVSNALFSGTRGGFGGLSNEKELARICPPEFKKGNRWTQLAGHFVYGDKKPALKWRSNDFAERMKQWDCFVSLLSTLELPHEDKIAVAGWMLSETTVEEPAA